ncbi:MAG TPA: excinuclease ABC subunit UvrA [Candidatus Omnitrophota bacterium]|nr:excinuclease ABC subunit UvrA [Candidatus Omnitrophota bacterium]
MDAILLRGIKTHNLKNFDLVLPHRKFYVVTGVSGSGKSSLAFDTLYAEGQRRYIESVSAYARQFLERMPKPDITSAAGIPPALAIQAKNAISNARSTVGTQTEINDYLRVAFARAGRLICPDCHIEVQEHDPAKAAERLLSEFQGQEARIVFSVLFSQKSQKYVRENFEELERQGFSEFFYGGEWLCAETLLRKKVVFKELSVCADRLKILQNNKERLTDSLEQSFRLGRGEGEVWIAGRILKFSGALRCFSCGRSFVKPTPNLFSFNSPLGACPTCQGFGRVITIDWDLVVPDPSKSIRDGAIEPFTKGSARWEQGQLLDFCERKRIPTRIPWGKLKPQHRKWILRGYDGDDFVSVQAFFDYLNRKTYKMHVRIFLNRYRGYVPCHVCHATRLKPEGLHFLLGGKNIAEVQALSIEELLLFLESLEFRAEEKEKIEPVHKELLSRVRFLKDVGLGYLTLDRMSRTLSGGEVERIHLASSLGSALVDTLYVLDEPSIGLHERDNQMLIDLLKKLRDLGNTVVVVEHDRTMIQSADGVIDLGPRGGAKGGDLVFQGSVEELKKYAPSITGEYLSGKRNIERTKRFLAPAKEKIVIRGAKAHNLKGLDVEIPLRKFVALTGVSGSGKSTFLYDILYHHFRKFKGQPVSQEDLGSVQKIRGFEYLADMVLIDQSPLGRSPRSNPATYLKAFDDIRKIFASTPQAKRAGFDVGHFSFNVEKGRCQVCQGDGVIKVEMHFLADIFVPCEECRGKRFKPGVLEIEYQGKNIDDILNMTVEEVLDFLSFSKGLVQKLSILKKIGLGYLRLGQPTLTLSGGEAQRLKLGAELSGGGASPSLYLLDEPTTGLHEDDIRYLMKAFEELLERGHSLLVIEHHMGVIRLADHVIDLGPDGGDRGGQVVYQGNVAGLMACEKSYTGQYLKKYF